MLDKQFSLLLFLISICFLNCNTSSENQEELTKTTVIATSEVSTNTAKTVTEKAQRSPLYTSTDYGMTWQSASQGLPENTQVTFIQPFGKEMIMATDNNGLFKSEKNRTNWFPIGETLPNLKINALHISDDTIFVGVFRQGIFTSTDGGLTWAALNYNLPDLTVQSVVTVGDKLLAGTDSGIFKFLDNKREWVNLFENVQVLSFNLFQNYIVAGTNKGVLLSKDKGETWDWIHQKGAVHYTALLEGTMVIMYVYNGLFLSSDWGENWIEGNYNPKTGSYVYETTKVGNQWIISNNYGVHRSADGGKNWELIFSEEDFVFFDFLVVDGVIYGGTRKV